MEINLENWDVNIGAERVKDAPDTISFLCFLEKH